MKTNNLHFALEQTGCRPCLFASIRTFAWLLLLCCLLGAFAFPSAAQENKMRIGVSLLTMTNPFFRDLGEAMREEAAKHNMEVLLTAAEFDAARQRHQVSDFIVKRVDAIVLSPADSKAVGTAIMEANRAGIPVFTVDIAALAPGAEVVSHVATDNYGGGRLAAQALIEAIEGEGKVAILDHPVVESVMLRTKGFHDELQEQRRAKGIKVEVVATLPGGGARDRSFQVAEDLLQAHPDLKGIFAINDPSALGAVAALEKAGKLNQVKIVGFDGMPEGKRAIKAGQIYADPIQFPDRIGQTAVQIIAKYFEGDEVPAEVLIPTQLYGKADAEKEPGL
jgi:ribose transport system substrate-binding protein